MLHAVQNSDFILNKLLISTVSLFLPRTLYRTPTVPWSVRNRTRQYSPWVVKERPTWESQLFPGRWRTAAEPVELVIGDVLKITPSTTPPPYLGGRLSVLGGQLLHRGVLKGARGRGPLHHAVRTWLGNEIACYSWLHFLLTSSGDLALKRDHHNWFSLPCVSARSKMSMNSPKVDPSRRSEWPIRGEGDAVLLAHRSQFGLRPVQVELVL